MKLFSYSDPGHGDYRLGAVVGDAHYDLNRANPALPHNMADFLAGGESLMALARQTALALEHGELVSAPLAAADLAAPVPKPSSCRDAYAFRQHVETSRRNRG